MQQVAYKTALGSCCHLEVAHATSGKAHERHVNVTYVARQCLPHYSHLCRAHMDIPFAKRSEGSPRLRTKH